MWKIYSTKDDFKNKILQDKILQIELLNDDILDKIKQKFIDIDPYHNKDFFELILNSYLQCYYNFENLDKIKNLLEDHKFAEKYNLFQESDKIIKHKIKDFNILKRLIKKYSEKIENKKREIEIAEKEIELAKKEIEEIYMNNYIRVIRVLTERASIYYGKNTKWCTSTIEDNFFHSYNNEGPIYILIPLNPTHENEKYQLHIESREFMDEKNKPISIKIVEQYEISLLGLFKELINKLKNTNKKQELIEKMLFLPLTLKLFEFLINQSQTHPIKIIDKYSCNLLFYYSNINILKILIEKYKLDVNWKNESNLTVFIFRLQRNNLNLDILQLLMKNGLIINNNINDSIENGRSLLHISENLEISQFLIQCGANVNQLDDNLNTPLHIMVIKNNPEILKLLIKNGAIIDIKNKSGDTPLSISINVYCTIILLLNGAKPNTINNIGNTPLHNLIENLSIQNIHIIQILKYLIYCGAKINQFNQKGETPLYVAAKNIKFKPKPEFAIDIILNLIEYGDNIIIIDDKNPLELILSDMIDQYQKYNEKLIYKILYELILPHNEYITDKLKNKLKILYKLVKQKNKKLIGTILLN